MDRSHFFVIGKRASAVPVTLDGQTFYVRRLPWREETEWNECRKGLGPEEHALQYLLLTICDESGERLFRDDEAEELKQLDAGLVGNLLRAAYKANQVDLDALAKNSQSEPNCDSQCGSPETKANPSQSCSTHSDSSTESTSSTGG